MLKPVQQYEAQLKNAVLNTFYGPYFHWYDSYQEIPKMPDHNGESHHFAIVNKNDKLIGDIFFLVDNFIHSVTSVRLRRFVEGPSSIFYLDVIDAIEMMFTRFKYNKIVWKVFIGNPAEKAYDHFAALTGATIVGTFRKDARLCDNTFVDNKVYELFREDYLTSDFRQRHFGKKEIPYNIAIETAKNTTLTRIDNSKIENRVLDACRQNPDMTMLEILQVMVKDATNTEEQMEYRHYMESLERNIQYKTIHGFKCALVKAGTIAVTSPNGGAPDRIHIGKDFWCGIYPVTNYQWNKILGNKTTDDNQLSDYPVVNVNWDDVSEFAKRVGGRLLTTTEWEFAARGGIYTHNYQFAGSDSLDEVGWYDGNCEGKIHEVGKKKPNELGIYDMSGNVQEWTSDTESHEDGMWCIYRGGGWRNRPHACHVTAYNSLPPKHRSYDLGFRIAFDVKTFGLKKIEDFYTLLGVDTDKPIEDYPTYYDTHSWYKKCGINVVTPVILTNSWPIHKHKT